MAAFVVTVLALLSVSGCAGYGTISRNMSENGAIVLGKFGTPWGVQEFTRVGDTTNTVLLEPPGGGRIWINPPMAPAPAAQPKQQSVSVPLSLIQEAYARKVLAARATNNVAELPTGTIPTTSEVK